MNTGTPSAHLSLEKELLEHESKSASREDNGSSTSQCSTAPQSARRVSSRIPAYNYEFSLDKQSSDIPFEVLSTEEFFYITLELPGLDSIQDISFDCVLLQDGYELQLGAFLRSLIPQKDNPSPRDTSGLGKRRDKANHARLLGEVTWNAIVKGVFVSRPECNYKHGLLKIRIKKRTVASENVDVVDF